MEDKDYISYREFRQREAKGVRTYQAPTVRERIGSIKQGFKQRVAEQRLKAPERIEQRKAFFSKVGGAVSKVGTSTKVNRNQIKGFGRQVRGNLKSRSGQIGGLFSARSNSPNNIYSQTSGGSNPYNMTSKGNNNPYSFNSQRQQTKKKGRSITIRL